MCASTRMEVNMKGSGLMDSHTAMERNRYQTGHIMKANGSKAEQEDKV